MKRTLIAAAVLASAAASSVYAAPPTVYLFNTTGVAEAIGIDGGVLLFGCVTVTSTAGAVINNNQSVTLSNTRLDPNYQDYWKGKVTTTFNNETKHVSATGSTSFNSDESTTTSSSSQSSESSTSSHDSHSATAWASGEDKNSLSSSTSQTTSSSLDTSAHSGHKAVSGVLTVTISANANSSESHTHTGNRSNGSSSEIEHFDANLNVAGAAGVVWDAASSTSTTHDDSKSTAASSSDSQRESGFNVSAHHDDESSSSSSSSSKQASSTETTSKHSSWTYNFDLDQTDEKTTGSVTHYVNTSVPGVLDAGTGANAASGVTGNLGVNIAEGIDNAQSNDVALASVDVGNVFGNAQIFSSQSSAGKATVNNFKLNATVGDGSLSNVSGNVGVNVASGIGNVQNNSLAGAVTTVNPSQVATVAMVATDDNTQTAAAQVNGRFEGTALLGANTLNGSTGNIGVNIAGGVGNVQHNGLAIAAMSVPVVGK
jgi:hypothetical protein